VLLESLTLPGNKKALADGALFNNIVNINDIVILIRLNEVVY